MNTVTIALADNLNRGKITGLNHLIGAKQRGVMVEKKRGVSLQKQAVQGG